MASGLVPPPTVASGEVPLLALESVGRRYGSDPPVEALRDVNLRVNLGEWLAIIGPSGSGKSTLLNVLGCLDRPTSGSYRFDGIDVAGINDGQRAGIRSRAIGFVFQAFHLLAHRSVLDNVMLSDIYRRTPRRGRRERGMEVLARVGLEDRAHFRPTRLSGGERQRVAIARSLMGSPRLLLCDEPTGNLDSATTQSVLELFGELNAHGLTIVMITHEPEVAARASRRVRIIDGLLSEAG